MFELGMIFYGMMRITEICKDRGYSAIQYNLLFVGGWLIAELLGYLLGATLFNVSGGIAYATGLVAAFGAGWLIFRLIDRLPNRIQSDEQQESERLV